MVLGGSTTSEDLTSSSRKVPVIASVDLSTGYPGDWVHWVSVEGQSSQEVVACAGNTIFSEDFGMLVTSTPNVFLLFDEYSSSDQFSL